MPSTRVFGFQIWNSDLIEFKKGLGLPLGDKGEVVIPDLFLQNNSFKASVVRGIFDTDGCVYLEKKNGKLYPRLEITTISNKLANQLRRLLIEMSFRATKYSIKPKEINRRLYHRISVRGVEMFHKFMSVIKPANPKHIAKYEKFRKSFK